jgi:hypothetical protein
MQDKIAKLPNTKGAMSCGIIYGSDKTTVSVATGQNEYWPLYETITSVTNATRRAQGGAVVLIGFLAIPKGKLYLDTLLLICDLHMIAQGNVLKMAVFAFASFDGSSFIRH